MDSWRRCAKRTCLTSTPYRAIQAGRSYRPLVQIRPVAFRQKRWRWCPREGIRLWLYDQKVAFRQKRWRWCPADPGVQPALDSWSLRDLPGAFLAARVALCWCRGYQCSSESTFRSIAHRLLSCRKRQDSLVQLAFRSSQPRNVHTPHRRHRRGKGTGGMGFGNPVGTCLAGS